jgi:hypothetical protein
MLVQKGTDTSLHQLLASTLESGVCLTARAPSCRRWSQAFGGRDDAGPRSPNTRERKWTRPHCSSSSSWCCCSAAVDSSTDAGLESEGRLARRDHSPRAVHAPTGCLGAIGDRTTSRGLRSTHRSTARSPGTPFLSGENRDIPALRARLRLTRGPRCPSPPIAHWARGAFFVSRPSVTNNSGMLS